MNNFYVTTKKSTLSSEEMKSFWRLLAALSHTMYLSAFFIRIYTVVSTTILDSMNVTSHFRVVVGRRMYWRRCAAMCRGCIGTSALAKKKRCRHTRCSYQHCESSTKYCPSIFLFFLIALSTLLYVIKTNYLLIYKYCQK